MNAPALQLSKTPLRQVGNVQELLRNEGARNQLAAVAAKHLTPERMMRVVANAIRTTPKLQQCEPMSFLGALMQCASLGLEPNTVLGHAYMIPFENRKKGITEVQVVIGYKGLIDLARRSGHITSISANIHYSDDELWIYEEGTEAQLRHRPGPQMGEKLHVYAIAKFKDGGHAYIVLPWAHVIKIRNASQGYQTAVRFNKKDSPWIAHEDEMAKKTAVRALAKYLPLSVEFMEAFEADDAKADYRSFAMDPTAGLDIEATAEDVTDGEMIEADQAQPAQPQIENTREVQADLLGQNEKPPAKTRNTSQKAAEPQQEQAESVESTERMADLQQLESIRHRIEGDLLDGMNPAEVAQTFAVELRMIRRQAPGIYRKLEDEFKAYGSDLVLPQD